MSGRPDLEKCANMKHEYFLKPTGYLSILPTIKI